MPWKAVILRRSALVFDRSRTLPSHPAPWLKHTKNKIALTSPRYQLSAEIIVSEQSDAKRREQIMICVLGAKMRRFCI